jgi:uncharacterized protein YggE
MKRIALIAPWLLSASLATASAQENVPRPRLISVVGTAEINVAPDEVILSLSVESRDKVLTAAKQQNDASAKKVMALASDVGIGAKDIRTSALRMNPMYSDDRSPRFLDYEVSQRIVITLRDLTKYETLMTRLLEAGITRVNGISFEVDRTRTYKDEARTKALQAAKEKAVAMAAELGQTVGKPWEISEQNSDNPYNGMLANSISSNSERAEPQESTVAPGQVTISASVRVSFQLE